MASIQNTVYYCCVWDGGRILCAYNGRGGHETETLAALCLEKAPSHHKWYFHTMFNKTFGFLMEDGIVYFAIVDENLGNPGVLGFLEHVRDEFKTVAQNGSNCTKLNPNSLLLQERFVPVVLGLITSLEHVNEATATGTATLSPSPTSNDSGALTKAPLLGKPSKHEKRKTRDHVISVRENGAMEEHRKSGDRGVVSKANSSSLDCGGGSVDAVSLTKEAGSTRGRSSSQSQLIRSKWCRQVRIVLAIDAAVCVTLFVVWIVVCGGTECIT